MCCRDIDMLLKGEGNFEDTNTLLTMKQQEINQQVKQQCLLNKLKKCSILRKQSNECPIT